MNLDLAKKVLDVEAQSILSLKEKIGPSFSEAAKLILSCKGRVIFFGIGKSGQIAQKLSSTFSSTGTPSFYIHPSEASHGDLGMLKEEDVVIGLSYGGDSAELTSLLNYLNRKKIPLIAITGNTGGGLARASSVVIDVKISKEACPLGLAPTASSTATLAMGDALAMVVMDAKKFKETDFAELHPGGGLGFKLSKVKDVMHTGGGFILSSVNDPLKKVFSKMSQAETRGAAGIIDEKNELVGIITDGDIRRRLETNDRPLEGVAKDMISKVPKSIISEESSEKALFLMEQFRINMLFVTEVSDVKKPIGIIHVQDLLRYKAGVK